MDNIKISSKSDGFTPPNVPFLSGLSSNRSGIENQEESILSELNMTEPEEFKIKELSSQDSLQESPEELVILQESKEEELNLEISKKSVLENLQSSSSQKSINENVLAVQEYKENTGEDAFIKKENISQNQNTEVIAPLMSPSSHQSQHSLLPESSHASNKDQGGASRLSTFSIIKKHFSNRKNPHHAIFFPIQKVSKKKPNYIRTTKYTLITFLPLNLYYQVRFCRKC